MKITGKSYLTIDTVGRLRTKEGAELDLGGIKRESMIGDGGVAGYKEEHMQASLTCKVLHASDVDIEKLNGLADVSVTLETDTGVSYLLTGAFTTEPCKLNTKTGEVDLKLEAIKGQKA